MKNPWNYVGVLIIIVVLLGTGFVVFKLESVRRTEQQIQNIQQQLYQLQRRADELDKQSKDIYCGTTLTDTPERKSRCGSLPPNLELLKSAHQACEAKGQTQIKKPGPGFCAHLIPLPASGH